MFCTTSEAECDRSKAVVLLWFSFACFGVIVSVTFHIMFVHIILVVFRLLSGHFWERAAYSVDHNMFSLYID